MDHEGRHRIVVGTRRFPCGSPRHHVEMVVTLEQEGSKVKMMLRFDRMHDETWTPRAAASWEMELNRLARRLSR